MVKNLSTNAGDVGSIPRSEGCSGEGNGNSLLYSCLGNSWAEEPGELQSMRSQRVRSDLASVHRLVVIINLMRKRKLFKRTK